jgi:hypothetical protein
MIKRIEVLITLASLWLSLASFAQLPRPTMTITAQTCSYEADVFLGDDAGYLRGVPIGHISVRACSSPADLANQVAAGEAEIRRAWATLRAPAEARSLLEESKTQP